MKSAKPTFKEADFPKPICTVDVVLLTLKDAALHVLLHRRPHEPFANVHALPGGYVHAQEDATAWETAARVLAEKTGIHSPYLEQLATYTGAKRDPRGWSVSIAYYALVPPELLPLADAKHLLLAPVSRLPRLAFDHRAIVDQAVVRLRSKSQYSSLPAYLCGDRITLPQLQSVYEAVLGEPVNKVSFRRKMDELGMLEPIAGELEGGAHRPAQVYQLRAAFRRQLSWVQRGINS